MEKKKARLVFVLCAGLFAAALLFGIFFFRGDRDRSAEGSSASVVLNEILSGNLSYPDENGRLPDFIELRNLSDLPVDISGYMLSDDGVSIGYTFPAGTVLPAGGYALCWCDKNGGDGYAGFGISRKGGDTVVLFDSAHTVLDWKDVPSLDADVSLVRLDDGSWTTSSVVSPGYENSQAGYEAWLRAMGGDMSALTGETPAVVISEVQTRNRGTITNAAGKLCDWIELWNTGDSTADLDGAYLSDDPKNLTKWRIAGLCLAPGERAVILCSGSGAVEGEADFTLSAKGCTLTLTNSEGTLISRVECPRIGANRVWALREDGSYEESDRPTPGFENTALGWEAYLDTRLPAGALVISEVMPSNNQYLRQSDGKYYDWLELYNASDETVELSDYALSDDADRPSLFQLPHRSLAPGERITVICSADASLKSSMLAPFNVNREEDFVYLTGPDGRFSDYIHVYEVPVGASVGRAEDNGPPRYFAEPTPGQKNGEGAAAISAVPAFLTAGGVYDGVESVTVELSAPGEIHYTLNGSEPTLQSAAYCGPITLDSTSVLRAAAFESGKLPSKTVTASYIINENHTLPVLSIAAEPVSMSRMYREAISDVELPGSLELFDGDGGFAIDGGVELYGYGQLSYQKKNIKVNFRGRYGEQLLRYPVFGEDGPSEYKALCLRAGQEYGRSIFKDELFASLCLQLGDNVLTQRNKFCVLYINGEYYGIYSLKEAFNATYYAQNRHVSEESVTIAQAPVEWGTEMYNFLEFCKKNDLSLPENYDYVAAHVDLDSLIDWMILQGYSANMDVLQNLRYFKSTENGDKWQLAFYDLDWAFVYSLPFQTICSNGLGLQHMALSRRLLYNEDFRQRFLERLSYAMETVLSNENVLATIDGYEALLAPEVPRERARWGKSVDEWKRDVQNLRNFIAQKDYLAEIVDTLDGYIGLTDQERETYFQKWAR